tara:strand:+ start:41528 stop:41992 length:465 start_codon:yes stop_codon:yes gene_type:complete
MSIEPETWLSLKRIVRFGDTDAAGVMHFHQLFRWCHEAWEESLELYGLTPQKIFPCLNSLENKISVFLPIVHCEADFFLPIQVGDYLNVELSPKRVNPSSFHVVFTFKRDDQEVAKGLISHRSINSLSREICPLPEDIQRWLEASSLNLGVNTI